MLRKLKIYLPFTRAGIQGAIAYRLNFLGFFIGEIMYCFIMYFLWRAVFVSGQSETFMGFTMVDMVTFLFISNLARYLVSSDSTYPVAEQIKSGNIIMQLIRPIQMDISILFEELGSKTLVISLITLPILIGVEVYRYSELGYIAFSLVAFVPFILSIVLAFILSFYLNICVGFLAFYLKNIWGFNMLKEGIIGFLSGAIIPIAFMPVALQGILEALPFASLSYTPVMIYMGKYQGEVLVEALVMQLFWAVAIYALSKWIWYLAIKKLSVQGG